MSDKTRRYFRTSNGSVFTPSGGAVPPPEGIEEVQAVPLDAIVIRRDELPKDVRTTHHGDLVSDGHTWTAEDETPETLEDMARASLAAAAYLREHPAGEIEGRVQEIVNRTAHDPDPATRQYLEELLRRGVITESPRRDV